MKKIIINLISITTCLAAQWCFAAGDILSLFPIEHYDQRISTWIKPTAADYNQPLISADMQKQRLQLLYDHYYGIWSPWNENYVHHLLRHTTPDFKNIEANIIDDFNNEAKLPQQIGYGENFRPYSKQWIEAIKENCNLSQFDNLIYLANNRGITTDNLHARALPTEDMHFYDYKIAGQGFPFDNLQVSTIWAGTPVYILGETYDHAWLLVLTPDEYVGWVKNSGVARADQHFIETWTASAKNHLFAITRTQTPLVDSQHNFMTLGYVGAIFPGEGNNNGSRIMVPVADSERRAIIHYADLAPQDAALMPLEATPHQFAIIMQTLIGRPYGWGGMFFDNDCSAELKSLLTPFGIWLPRHSSNQVTVGKMVDMSAASPAERLHYLMTQGKPFLTIIYIGGHVVMYVGNDVNPQQPDQQMAMTYQDVWGLTPKTLDRRAVIGKSVFLPMLLQYPEDSTLLSAAEKKYFQVAFLNQMPDKKYYDSQNELTLKSLMLPGND